MDILYLAVIGGYLILNCDWCRAEDGVGVTLRICDNSELQKWKSTKEGKIQLTRQPSLSCDWLISYTEL